MILVEGRWAATADARAYASGAETMPWLNGVDAETLSHALGPLVSCLRVEPLLDPEPWDAPSPTSATLSSPISEDTC